MRSIWRRADAQEEEPEGAVRGSPQGQRRYVLCVCSSSVKEILSRSLLIVRSTSLLTFDQSADENK